MSDHEKTREELIAELRALRARLGETEGPDSGVEAPGSTEPEESADPGRRHLIKWVTPVILSSATLPKTLYAQGFGPPAPPTPAPTPAPTPGPTPAPTPSPTPSPTPGG